MKHFRKFSDAGVYRPPLNYSKSEELFTFEGIYFCLTFLLMLFSIFVSCSAFFTNYAQSAYFIKILMCWCECLHRSSVCVHCLHIVGHASLFDGLDELIEAF